MRTAGLTFTVLMAVSAMVSAAPTDKQGGLLIPRDEGASPVTNIANSATKLDVSSLTSAFGGTQAAPEKAGGAATESGGASDEGMSKLTKCGGSGPGLTDGDSCDEHQKDHERTN